jgi:transposase
LRRLTNRINRAADHASLIRPTGWNPQLIALYQRLRANGKLHKVALVACARKMLVFVNAILERGTPWTKSMAST